jgi:hypothetical protein
MIKSESVVPITPRAESIFAWVARRLREKFGPPNRGEQATLGLWPAIRRELGFEPPLQLH